MTSSLKRLPSDEYLAGLFDGEGTFCTNVSPKSGGGYTFRAAVSMTAPAPPTAFKHRFGGGLYTYQPSRAGARLTYEWHVSGLTVVTVAEALCPFLLVKHEQARTLIRLRQALEVDGRKAGVPATIATQRAAAAHDLAALNKGTA